jgi:hypothetical protein
VAALGCTVLIAGCASGPVPSSTPAQGSAPGISAGPPSTSAGTPSASASTPSPGPADSSLAGLPIGIGNSGATANSQVTLTPQTVVIPLAQVQSSLMSVSADGSTYTFANGSGPLAQLGPGKVMLLQGLDVADVTSVASNGGGGLVVTTTPASLSDVMQSGHIQVQARPDFSSAFGAELAGGPSAGAFTIAGQGPRVADGQPQIVLAAASPRPSNTFAFKQTSGGFTYKISFTGKADGVHVTGEFCYQLVGSSSGSSCGNGLSMQARLDGVFAWNDQNASFSTKGGAVADDSLSIDGLTGSMNINYVVLRGQNSDINADPPVLKIPFAFEFPLCPGPIGCNGIPLYSKVELAILIKLGVSGKNSTMEGGVNLTLNGSASGSQAAGSAPSGPSTFSSISGSFTPGTSITPGASAAELALQFKFGVGLGYKGLNVMNYLAFVPAVGQVTGSAVAGELCENYYGDFKITYNAEAQLFGLSYATPAAVLYEKKATYKQPGCS